MCSVTSVCPCESILNNKESVLNNKQRRNASHRAIRTFGYALICLPIVVSFLYVRQFGVNVPVTDTWVMAPLFEKLFSGDLSVGDLWAQHYEHRPLLPRIFLLLMGPLASFNNVTIMYAIQLCLLATFACVFLAYRDTVGLDTKSLFFAVPVSLLVFSLSQFWNMFHAWAIHVVVVVSFGVLSFLLLGKIRGKEKRTTILLFLASMLSASAATLSAGHGLLVWPVGLIQLVLEPIIRIRKQYLLTIWTLTGIVHWAVYFWGYEAPTTGQTPDKYFFSSSTLGLDSFLGLIGSALFLDSALAVATGTVIGALLVLVIFWIVKNREQERHTFWISLSVFSLLTLAATTAGRGGGELDSVIQSKYVTFSVLLTVGVYVMALKLARDHVRPEFSALPLGVCAGLIIVSAPLSYYSSVERAENLRMSRERAAYILFTYKDRRDTPLNQAVRHPNVRDKAAIFDDLNYTIFSKPASEMSPPTPEAQSKQ